MDIIVQLMLFLGMLMLIFSAGLAICNVDKTEAENRQNVFLAKFLAIVGVLLIFHLTKIVVTILAFGAFVLLYKRRKIKKDEILKVRVKTFRA